MQNSNKTLVKLYISSKNVQSFQRLSQADVRSRSHHKWMCKRAKAASSGRSRYAPSSIAAFTSANMNGTKGQKTNSSAIQPNKISSEQEVWSVESPSRGFKEGLHIPSVPTRVKSKGRFLKFLLNFSFRLVDMVQTKLEDFLLALSTVIKDMESLLFFTQLLMHVCARCYLANASTLNVGILAELFEISIISSWN